MKTAIIMQTRMRSTRLPGKVMKTVLGKPLLEYEIERLWRVSSADEIIVATTDDPSAEPIVQLCERVGVACFRGSEEDVLARYYGAATTFHADPVVRVTSDCPLIDPYQVDRVIRYYHTHQHNYDYIANWSYDCATNSTRTTLPLGMSTEIFSCRLLTEAFHEANLRHEREHVTPFFYTQPDRYRLFALIDDPDYSRHRWTVDTPEDFELIKRIIEALYPDNPAFTMTEVLALLASHPEWPLLNQHVAQTRLPVNRDGKD